MPIARDPRYDILFVDTDQAGNEIERLPLMMREGGGGLDFNIAYTSPFAGRLPNNDVQDNDNTRYNVRTQRDWRGGLGQEFAYQETNQFAQSLADTRFRNQLMLPPKPQGTTISGSGDPQWTPAQAGVVVGTKRAKAEWTKGSRVDVDTANTSATWAAQSVSNATSDASAAWAALGQLTNDGNTGIAYNNAGTATVWLDQSFVCQVSATYTFVDMYIARSATTLGTQGYNVNIYSDNGSNRISAYLGGAAGSVNSLPTSPGWVRFSLGAGVALVAGTKYHLYFTVDVNGNASGVNWFANSTGSVNGNAITYNSVSGTWTDLTWDFQFRFYAPKQQTRLSQRILAVASVSTTQIKIPISASAWTGSPTLTAKLCADSAGAIGSVLQSVTTTNPGGSIAWVTFTIPSQALSAGTFYWIVLEADAPTTSDAITVSWQRDANGNYPSGVGYSQTQSGGGGWSGYTAVGGCFYFSLNTGYAGNHPFFDGNAVARYRNAQSFTGDGNSYTQVILYLKRGTWTGSPALTVSIYADSSGAPAATALRTVSMSDPGANWAWVTATFAALTLTNATAYWLVLESNAPTTSDAIRVSWQKDSAQGYAGGAGNYQSGANYSAWSGLVSDAGDYYFLFGTLGGTSLGYYSHDKTVVRWAESITPGSTISLTRFRFYAQQIARSGNATVTLILAQNNAGNPGTTITSLVLTADKFNTTALSWVDVAIASTLAGSTTYWFMIDCDAPAVGDAVQIDVGVDTAGGYAGAFKTATITNYVAGAWGTDAADMLFIVNNGIAVASPVTAQPVQFGGAWYMASDTGIYRFAEVVNSNTSFENSLTGWTLQKDGSSTQGYSTDAIKGRYSVSVTKAANSTYAYLQSSNIAATSGSIYQIAMWCKGSAGVGGSINVWAFDAGMAFIGYLGVSTIGGANGDWEYITFTGTAPANTAYIAAVLHVSGVGTVLFDDVRIMRYEWVLKNNCSTRVTALQPFAGKLYAALGDSDDMVESSDGNTWAVTSGSRRYTYLRAFGGYLYASKSVGGANALAYTDGTTWVTNLTVATADQALTGLAAFNNELIIFGARSMYSLSSAYVYQIYDYSNEEDQDNGRNALTWMVNGLLHVPVRNGLNAYDGVKMQTAGPDQNEGLPAGEQGRIAAMCGSKTWLFAALDAGPNGTSSILAYNGTGWHTLAKANGVGKRIRAIGIETVTNARAYSRLWWFEESTPYFVEFPSLTDNPYQFVGAKFASSGYVTSSWFGGEVALIQKDFNAIAVWSLGCSANQTAQVYYEVDQSGLWNLAGTVTVSPYQEFTLGAPAMANKVAGAGCTTTTINLQSGMTTDMGAGRFVRIGAEVAQVATIVSATQFTLALPLSAAPAAGTNIVTSGAAGRQIRYRLVMATNDETKTPKIIRVSIRTMGAVLAKARVTLSPRIEDNVTLRTGAGQYPLTAAALRTKLYEWVRRSKPFIMVDMFGQNWAVKITGQSESVPTRQDDQSKGAMTYRSSMRLEMDEV